MAEDMPAQTALRPAVAGLRGKDVDKVAVAA
jgi:hypothetical protein